MLKRRNRLLRFVRTLRRLQKPTTNALNHQTTRQRCRAKTHVGEMKSRGTVFSLLRVCPVGAFFRAITKRRCDDFFAFKNQSFFTRVLKSDISEPCMGDVLPCFHDQNFKFFFGCPLVSFRLLYSEILFTSCCAALWYATLASSTFTKSCVMSLCGDVPRATSFA